MNIPKLVNRCFWGTAVLLALLKISPANAQVSLECQQGQLECVDRVIQEMERRYELLVQAGDPDALFALNYLRTTETFRETFDEIGYSDRATPEPTSLLGLFGIAVWGIASQLWSKNTQNK